MPKQVFRPTEIINLDKRLVIEAPGGDVPEIEEVAAPIEAYEGPTADDLRREAEAFKSQWDREREAMVAAARAEAEKIVKDAEVVAFDEVKRKSNQAAKIRQDAEDEAARIVAEAQENAKGIEANAQERMSAVEKDAYRKGFDQGREAGFQEGKAEVQRLVDRLHIILQKAMEKRAEILESTENQIVDMVLLIAKKVIKVISENQRNVVVSNVVQALRKIKSRGDVIIKVNLADLQLASAHTKDFMQIVENVKSITVVEDNTVDRGGCVIETDFGQIDARISSQLSEIEERILEIAPIRSRAKDGVVQ
jgi:flagellar assembly protein FliH